MRTGALGVTVAQELARSEDPALQQDTIERAKQGVRVRVRDVKPPAPQATTEPEPAEPEPADVEINFHAPAGPQATPSTESRRIGQDNPAASRRPDVEINFHPTTSDVAPRPGEDSDPRDQLTTAPPLASTPQPTAGNPPAEGSAAVVDPGQVRLRDLRLIQLREGRDGEPRQLDSADTATVLRILRADLAWLENSDRQVPQE